MTLAYNILFVNLTLGHQLIHQLLSRQPILNILRQIAHLACHKQLIPLNLVLLQQIADRSPYRPVALLVSVVDGGVDHVHAVRGEAVD